MPRIQILPDRLVSQIAAGEVVERPSSVVKELVENALDAGATRLEIDLEGGGRQRIRIADDGSGMDRDDALLAFDRHATSKITSMADLEQVATLGFRGEALATIAAVAKVELTTAMAPGEGTRVLLEGGRILAVEPTARTRGTTIDVASLFFNVPARRKFLKSRETELRRCVEVVEGYVLARPDVSFRLRSEGRVLLEASAQAGGEDARSDGLRRRIGEVFGQAFEKLLVKVSSGEAPAAGSEHFAHGFVGSPATARGARRSFVFVNRRLVRDRAVLATFYRAVRDEWRSDEFPSLFLFIELLPFDVDVNVHPQKAEVRFRDPRLMDRLGETLRLALARARGEEAAPLRTTSLLPEAPFAWEGSGGRSFPHQAGFTDEVREGLSAGSVGTVGQAVHLAELSLAPLDRAPVPLSGRGGETRRFRLLGQYKGALILLEGPDGLYLIDQHVAHERVLYERFRRSLATERADSQRLVAPLVLELSRGERLRLVELAPALEPAGFEISELSGGSLAVAATPAVLSPAEGEALLLRLAADSAASPENLGQRILDDFAASLACKAAVKMHQAFSAEKLEALVSELFAAENPYACPHGRPVVLQLTDADLERRFGRR
ncbi:MAG: DNA mismatch repair endonuclease MutL [Thermoanaerobaculia bacterium]|jgi:DNA mismatch repair protein MutL|nr:DNA mismatch repair endonuclease MutL [Thermoanaerobaculia bacterium]MBP9825642.1 DNA mismatch repair endonuclease MutL [Thermoanaerobaculia bacterium]